MPTATTTARTAPTPVDPRVALTFAHKQHAKTIWIEGEYATDARPDALFAALAEIGWTLDPVMESVPAYRPYDWDESRPRGEQMVFRDYEVKDFALIKPGTGLFTGQTAEEARAFKSQARAVLRRYGFTRVPTWTKTLADML